MPAVIQQRLWIRRAVMLAGALGLSVLLIGVAPASAHANVLAGFPNVGDLVGKAVEKIFGVEGDWITGTFVQWLIKVEPPYLTKEGAAAEVYEITRAIGFAAMGAFVTFSIVHFWAVGVTSQGGGSAVAAFDAVARSCGAGLMILAWPFLIDNGVKLVNIASDRLVPGGMLDAIAAFIVGGTVLASVVGQRIPMLIGIILMIAIVVVILVLVVTKVMLTASLMALAAGMPLALAAWSIPSLSWAAAGLMRWSVAIPAVQLAWAAEFGLYGRLPKEFFLWDGGGAFVERILRPLTMLALLAIMLSTASAILRLAGYSGGSFIGSMATYSAPQALGNVAGRVGAPVRRVLSIVGIRI